MTFNYYTYCSNSPILFRDITGNHQIGKHKTRWLSYIPFLGVGYTATEGIYHTFFDKYEEDGSLFDVDEWQHRMVMSTFSTAIFGSAMVEAGFTGNETIGEAWSMIKDMSASTWNSFTSIFKTKKKLGISYKNITTTTAESVNAELYKSGYTNAPYKPGSSVQIIKLKKNTQFVRVYNIENASQKGGWMMQAEDIAGLTPEQIQIKYSLTYTPTHVTDVILSKGTELRTGIVNNLLGYDGNAIQFDLMGQYTGKFINERLLP